MSGDGFGNANGAPIDLHMGSLYRFLVQRGINGSKGQEILDKAGHSARNGRISAEPTDFLSEELAAAFVAFAGSEDEQYAVAESGVGF